MENKRQIGTGIVKEVISGDSLLLMGRSLDGSFPPEKQLTLSGISCPRIGRGKKGSDEPFAFHAREFLRKKCIGQVVSFTINYSTGTSQREYGSATLLSTQEDLASSIVGAGWASVMADKSGKIHAEKQHLADLMKEAKDAKRGMWNKASENPLRVVKWVADSDAAKLYSQFKNKPLPGIIDYVLDGSTLRIELMDTTGKLSNKMITMYLAGVQCPRVPLPFSYLQQVYNKRVIDNPELEAPKKEAPPAYSMEAQFYVNARLLHRNVEVVIQGMDKSNRLFGSIIYPKGNISIKMLSLGLGKIVDWSASCTKNAAQMKTAEQLAKAKGIGVWSTHDDSAEVKEVKIVSTKISSVISGDCFTTLEEGVEKRYNLASISAPRFGRRGEPEPYAWEAKEFFRKKVIGKKVSIKFEYSRTAPKEARDQSLREYVTVYSGRENISESLVLNGLATVISHRMEDNHASMYGAYISAEEKAKKQGKGQHSHKGASKRVTDLTDRPRRSPKSEEDKDKDGEKKEEVQSKAKQFLPFLTRSKSLTGVVDYCFTGSRFKIYIPSENVLISFAIAGVRAPIAKKNEDGSRDPNPYGDMALNIVKKNLLQRQVKIEIENIDRGDNFIGSIFINNQNVALMLLQNGLASLIPFSAKRSNYADALFKAEAEAKEAKKNMWLNYVEPVAEETTDDTADEVETGIMKMTVTEITDAVTFYVQKVDDPNVELVNEKMKAFSAEPTTTPEGFAFTKGLTCAGQFDDEQFYRVRIDGKANDTDYRVFFVDFGNADVLPESALRPLPSDVEKIPGLARACMLAGVKPPSSASEYSQEAAMYFNDLVWERVVVGKIIMKDNNGKLHLNLFADAADTVSINKTLIAESYCRVVDRPLHSVKPLIKELEEAQETAIRARISGRIWEYGDVSDDEEEESTSTRKRDDGRVPRRTA